MTNMATIARPAPAPTRPAFRTGGDAVALRKTEPNGSAARLATTGGTDTLARLGGGDPDADDESSAFADDAAGDGNATVAGG